MIKAAVDTSLGKFESLVKHERVDNPPLESIIGDGMAKARIYSASGTLKGGHPQIVSPRARSINLAEKFKR